MAAIVEKRTAPEQKKAQAPAAQDPPRKKMARSAPTTTSERPTKQPRTTSGSHGATQTPPRCGICGATGHSPSRCKNKTRDANDLSWLRGWESRDVGGQGNCFFRSVAAQLPELNCDAENHAVVRCLAVTWIRSNKEAFLCSFADGEVGLEKYCRWMQKDRIWAEGQARQHIDMLTCKELTRIAHACARHMSSISLCTCL